MHGGHDGHVGPEIAIIADGHPRVVLHGKVEIHKAMGADAGVASVMKADGPQHEGAFAHRFHQFFQNLLPGLCVLPIEIAEFLAEPVGLQFPGHQFVHLGGKKLSFKDSLFFRHGAFLLSLFPFASISENPQKRSPRKSASESSRKIPSFMKSWRTPPSCRPSFLRPGGRPR